MGISDKIGTEKQEIADETHRARLGLTRQPMDENVAKVVADAQRAEETQRTRQAHDGERKPFGVAEQQLAWAEIPGMRLYWFNETPGRLDRAKRAGYDHVLDKDGSPVMRIVGPGVAGSNGQKAYLMQIPIEWYQQDRAAYESIEADRMAQIKAGALRDAQVQKGYIPDRGIKITANERR